MNTNKIYQGDCLEILKTFSDNSIDMVMTSPPYWALRDYGVKGQLGLEPTFEEYINRLCDIFDEVKRVLKKQGTCWVNLGDTYSTISGNMGSKEFNHPKYKSGKKVMMVKQPKTKLSYKCLCMIPERFAIEMINRGWTLRNQIIWNKPNCMPSSVKDRFTVDFEKIFFFVKNKKYFFEQQLEKFKSKPTKLRDKRNKEYGKAFLSPLGKGLRNGYEQGSRNKRTIWTITTKPYTKAHFATYPEKLCETPIKAGCPEEGIVLDPFFGAGTTGLVALKHNRKFIGIELNPEYINIAEKRLRPWINQTRLKQHAKNKKQEL